MYSDCGIFDKSFWPSGEDGSIVMPRIFMRAMAEWKVGDWCCAENCEIKRSRTGADTGLNSHLSEFYGSNTPGFMEMKANSYILTPRDTEWF